MTGFLRGVTYDVGTTTGPYRSRPHWDAELVGADLTAIRDELHADAVRVHGSELDRLVEATELAVGLGLDVWVSPQLHDATPIETIELLDKAAQRVADLADGQRVVFVAVAS